MRHHPLRFCAAVLMLLASTTAAHADVQVTKAEDGGVEMLSVYESHKTASLIFDRGRSRGIGNLEPDKLVPALSIAPTDRFERGAVDWLKKTMARLGIRALRYPIARASWALLDIEPVLSELLPGHSGGPDRAAAATLAEENPNVYLEWCGSSKNPTDWCETLQRVGNRRLVYGSDGVSWEVRWGHNPAFEMGRLLSLDVPDETLLPILGDNMRNILARRW